MCVKVHTHTYTQPKQYALLLWNTIKQETRHAKYADSFEASVESLLALSLRLLYSCFRVYRNSKAMRFWKRKREAQKRVVCAPTSRRWLYSRGMMYDNARVCTLCIGSFYPGPVTFVYNLRTRAFLHTRVHTVVRTVCCFLSPLCSLYLSFVRITHALFRSKIYN